jgi:hypothetical protein
MDVLVDAPMDFQLSLLPLLEPLLVEPSLVEPLPLEPLLVEALPSMPLPLEAIYSSKEELYIII